MKHLMATLLVSGCSIYVSLVFLGSVALVGPLWFHTHLVTWRDACSVEDVMYESSHGNCS